MTEKDKENHSNSQEETYEEMSSYAIKAEESKHMSGKEIQTIDETGDVWMGEYPRNLVESNRNKTELPTQIGYTQDDGEFQDVYVDHNALFRHMALFGSSGYGRSALIRNIILQWISSGYGMCYIDPKGDDSYELLKQIPSHRKDDIVWIEPNANQNGTAGFNVFDTASDSDDDIYGDEVEALASGFRDILESWSDDWSSEDGNTIESLVAELIRADNTSTLVDLVSILTKERDIEDLLEDYDGDLRKDVQQFDNQEVVDMTHNWVKDRTTQELIAKRDAQVNISEAIRDGELLVLDTSKVEGYMVRDLITRMMIYKVWSTIRTRPRDANGQLDPYFLCIEEFDKVVPDTFDINKILSMARSFRLSVFLGFQQPTQLLEDTKRSIQQVQSIMSFYPGPDLRDQNEIAKLLGDIDPEITDELNRYEVVMRPYMNGSQQDLTVLRTYPPYPPRREDKDAEQIIEESLEKYGS